jgi:hypothetical protein
LRLKAPPGWNTGAIARQIAGPWLFRLRLEPELDQPADGFGARGRVVLASGPSIEGSHKLVGKAKRARKLATTPPTTLAGVAAVLRFANEIEDGGMEGPNTDAVGREGWHYQLRATMAAAIEALMKAERAVLS